MLIVLYFSFPFLLNAQSWHPVGDKIMTPWADQVNPSSPLPEYPRPQMVRSGWSNLNGLWQYQITPASQQTIPAIDDGRILVPYAVESALSGVGKRVGKDNLLWYKRTINQSKPKKETGYCCILGLWTGGRRFL